MGCAGLPKRPGGSAHPSASGFVSGRREEFLVRKLDDRWRAAVEITEADPGRTHANIHDPRPGLARRTVRPRSEIGGFDALELLAGRLVGDALVLYRALVT